MKLVNEEIRFELVSNMVLNNTQLVTVKYDNSKNMWHSVSILFLYNSRVELITHVTLGKKKKLRNEIVDFLFKRVYVLLLRAIL